LFHGLHFGAGEIDSSWICIIVLLVADGEEDHDASVLGAAELMSAFGGKADILDPAA
jgi:hypothetical protein